MSLPTVPRGTRVTTKKTTKLSRAPQSSRPKAAPRAGTKRTVTAKPPPPLESGPPPAPLGPRRAIFIDVENTSSEQGLLDVIDSLKIDHRAHATELAAVGNWRAVGQQLGRRLAAVGAQLVHSAPAKGVRDWSDLWIAVAAGCWLGRAVPGDVLEIVSNDRAFDAVGDAAAARGVIYRRLQHRRGAAAPVSEAEPKPASTHRKRGGRRRRRGAGAPRTVAPTPASAEAGATMPVHAGHPVSEPHGASREQMTAVIRRLTNGEPGRWVNLDVLEKALKAEGFSRPPGSPRLVTRLRTLKEVEIDAHGRVRLAVGHSAAE